MYKKKILKRTKVQVLSKKTQFSALIHALTRVSLLGFIINLFVIHAAHASNFEISGPTSNNSGRYSLFHDAWHVYNNGNEIRFNRIEVWLGGTKVRTISSANGSPYGTSLNESVSATGTYTYKLYGDYYRCTEFDNGYDTRSVDYSPLKTTAEVPSLSAFSSDDVSDASALSSNLATSVSTTNVWFICDWTQFEGTYLYDTHTVSVSKPVAPTSFTVGSFNADGDATLSWTSVEPEGTSETTSYYLFRQVGLSKVLIYSNVDDTSITINQSSLSEGTHTLSVAAKLGNFVGSEREGDATLVKSIPDLPSNYPRIQVTNGSLVGTDWQVKGTDVGLSWTEISGANFYRVSYSSASHSARTATIKFTSDGDHSFSVRGCYNAYEWSCSDAGGTSYNVQHRQVPAKPPVITGDFNGGQADNTIRVIDSPGAYEINWQPDEDDESRTDNYKVYNGSSSFTTTATRYAPTSAENGSDLTYTIYACNDFACETTGDSVNVRVRYQPGSTSFNYTGSDISPNVIKNTPIEFDFSAQYGTRYTVIREFSNNNTSTSWSTLGTEVNVDPTDYAYTPTSSGYYRFRVHAYNEFDWSTQSTYSQVFPVGAKPNAPTINTPSHYVKLAPNPSDAQRVHDITWTNPAPGHSLETLNDNNVYHIDGASETKIDSSTGVYSSYTLTGLTNREDNVYKVEACNAFGCSNKSTGISVVVRETPMPVAILESNAQLQTTDGTVDVSWCRSSNLVATDYSVVRREPNGSAWTETLIEIDRITDIETGEPTSEVDYYIPLSVGAINVVVPHTDPREVSCEHHFYTTNVRPKTSNGDSDLAISVCNDEACSEINSHRLSQYRVLPNPPVYVEENSQQPVVETTQLIVGADFTLNWQKGDSDDIVTHFTLNGSSQGLVTSAAQSKERGDHNYYLAACNDFACRSADTALLYKVRFTPAVNASDLLADPVGNNMPVSVSATPIADAAGAVASNVALDFDLTLSGAPIVITGSGNQKTGIVSASLLSTTQTSYNFNLTVSDEHATTSVNNIVLPFIYISPTDSVQLLGSEGDPLRIEDAPISATINNNVVTKHQTIDKNAEQ